MTWLPLSYAVSNLSRRPARSALLVTSATLIATAFVAVFAFANGMRESILTTAPPNTALLLSTSATRDVIRSSVRRDVADLVRADVEGVLASSPEIHMATEFATEISSEAHQGFVRGVTEAAYAVHRDVTLIAGRLPGPGEALVGRLAHAAASIPEDELAIGRTLLVEGGTFRISGTFAARGSTTEGEIWLPLDELQSHARRADCSVVFVRTRTTRDLDDVLLFAHRRLDLELVAIDATTYYGEAAAYLAPIRTLAIAMAWMIGIAAFLSGANAFHAAIRERTRELACFLAMGFRVRALAASLVQESLWLGMIGLVVGTSLARFALSNATYRIAMSAFEFRVDSASIVAGAASVLAVSALGVLPALVSIARLPIATALEKDG